ncbi:hypothetical protein [Rosistilla oblonga]
MNGGDGNDKIDGGEGNDRIPAEQVTTSSKVVPATMSWTETKATTL